jgi:hypothetical protein
VEWKNLHRAPRAESGMAFFGGNQGLIDLAALQLPL